MQRGNFGLMPTICAFQAGAALQLSDNALPDWKFPHMKLFFSPASPFARKVAASAHELGLFDQLTIIPATVSPVEKDKVIAPHNPASKIPTLVTDQGEAIFDSRVIVEYLDSLAGGGKMIPNGEGRWKALVLQSLCDEALDALILTRYERVLRPEPLRWAEWEAGQLRKVATTLDVLENDWLHYLSGHVDIGSITACSLMAYLDFRFPDFDWRSGRPKIAAWFEGYSKRPAMEKTAPRL